MEPLDKVLKLAKGGCTRPWLITACAGIGRWPVNVVERGCDLGQRNEHLPDWELRRAGSAGSARGAYIKKRRGQHK